MSLVGCSFEQIENEISFLHVRGSYKSKVQNIVVRISDTIFKDSHGKYGIKSEESSNVNLTTERCTITNNDMTFL